MIRSFSREFLVNVLDGSTDAADVVEDTVIEITRWSVIHDFTFKFEGKYWNTSYSEGATEYQDESPWEGNDTVECTEVIPVQKTITVYEPVKD